MLSYTELETILTLNSRPKNSHIHARHKATWAIMDEKERSSALDVVSIEAISAVHVFSVPRRPVYPKWNLASSAS